MKVMTLNINAYGTDYGPWTVRKGLIAKAVKAGAPDALALQAVRKEMRFNGGLDQAVQVASAVSGYPYVAFEPASIAPDGSSDGLAFLARSAPAETGSLRLTLKQGAEDQNRRAVFQGVFRPNGDAFRIFNAHFSWIDEQNGENVREALAYIGSFDGPAILVGDFNAPPDAPALAAIATAGWVDLWSKLRPDDPGYTFPADEPDRRIDFIWANPAAAGRARSIEVVEANGDGGGLLSDHLGLIAEIR